MFATDQQRARLSSAVTLGGAALCAGIGLLVLAGWAFGLEIVRSAVPGGVSKPNTAAGFVLAGIALWLISGDSSSASLRRKAETPFAILIALIGFGTLVEFATGSNLGIDELLVRNAGRMAPAAAFNLLLAGTSLLLLRFDRARLVAQATAVALFFLALSDLVIHSYGLEEYPVAHFAPMAAHAAVAFMVLSLAILFASPDHGVLPALFGNDIQGMLLRRLLPVAVGLPLIIGWIRIYALRKDRVEWDVATALMVMLAMVASVLVVWWISAIANREEMSRRRADAELRASEDNSRERLRRIVDADILGIVVGDLTGRLVLANDCYLRMVGYSRQEFEQGNVDFLAITPPEWRAATERGMKQIRELGTSTPFEKEYLRRDGTRVPVLVASARLPGAEEQVVAFILDLSDRRRAEAERYAALEALQRSEEHFRSLIENSSDLIMILSRDGILQYLSPSIRTILGYEPHEWTGKSLLDLQRPDGEGPGNETIAARMSAASRQNIEAEFRHASGAWRSFEIISSSFVLEGEPRIIATARDVTERNALRRNLEQANRIGALGRLAATIAHEINNVLMGIQPFAEVIRNRAAEDPQLAQAAEHIVQSIHRGRRVTQEILRFVKAAEPQLASIRIRDLFQSVEVEARTLLPPTIVITLDAGPEDLWVRADKEQMTQVLMNLVINARDASPRGGQIAVVGSRAGDDSICITVVDSGDGMTREVREHIFDPLFTTKREGTGLGLSVVHQVIAKHDGTIEVESSPGHGASFTMTLPASESTTQAPATAAPAVLTRGGRVLLVEDDPAVAAGLRLLLETRDFEVRTIERGSEAEATAEQFRPDAIVLDYSLPDMTGAAVYNRLARRWPGIPTVFSTGQGEVAELKAILSNPAVALLIKPYDSDALIAQLSAVLAQGRAVARIA